MVCFFQLVPAKVINRLDFIYNSDKGQTFISACIVSGHLWRCVDLCCNRSKRGILNNVQCLKVTDS